MDSLLNIEVSELIGMHVGDGTLYRTTRGLVWELRGSLEEKEYYNKNVSKLMKRIFKKEYKPKFRSGGKRGCYGVQTSDKDVTNLFVSFDFPVGKKTKTVTIPEKIKLSEEAIKCAFIRGCFDTDGCLRFERKNKDISYRYPRIEFSTSSKVLSEELTKMLSQLTFRVHCWGKDEFKVSLAGKDNLERFMRLIRPKNKKHLNKYLCWKKNGFRNPNAVVA